MGGWDQGLLNPKKKVNEWVGLRTKKKVNEFVGLA